MMKVHTEVIIESEFITVYAMIIQVVFIVLLLQTTHR